MQLCLQLFCLFSDITKYRLEKLSVELLAGNWHHVFDRARTIRPRTIQVWEIRLNWSPKG